MFSVSHCHQQPRTRVLLIQSDPTQAPFQDKPQIFWLSTRTWRCGFKCVEALLSGRINELLSLINTWRSPVLFHNSDTVNNSKYNSRGSEVTSLWSKALQGSRCSPTAVPENSRQVIYWQADSTCKQRQEPHPSNNICVYELLCRTATAVSDSAAESEELGLFANCKNLKPPNWKNIQAGIQGGRIGNQL